MAQIDFKNATIYIKDGTRTGDTSGLVNNSGGYAAGATTITVDGLTTAATVGQYIEFAGDPVTHIISAVTNNSLGYTTQVTIASGLTKAIADDAIVYLRSSNQITITVGEGNLTFTEARNVEYTLDRGVLDEVRLGDEIPVSVTLDTVWEYYSGSSTSGADPTPVEAIKKKGNASSWVSTDADACRPYAVDIVILYAPDCGGFDQEEIILPDFRWESIDFDLDGGTISMSGSCNSTEVLSYRSTISS